jgi:hypothetical protein
MHIHQSVSLMMDKDVLLVKLAGFGQVGIRPAAPEAVGNPDAQAALLRVPQRAFGTAISEEKRAQPALEMHVFDKRRLKVALHFFFSHRKALANHTQINANQLALVLLERLAPDCSGR